MPYKINKIVVFRDYVDFYQNLEFSLDAEFQFPFVAGEMQDLIPEEARLDTSDPLIVKQPLFNKSGLTKLSVNTGKNGVCFIEVREGYILEEIISNPKEIVLDIYCSDKDRLIYSFYNSKDVQNIVVSGKLKKDSKGILKSIKADPADIMLREKLANESRSDWDERYRQVWIYRIVLPVEDNDGLPIPYSKFEDTRSELLKLAGGLTIDDITKPRNGYWINEQGVEKPDKVVILIVGCKENQDTYFSNFKEELKKSFKQDDVRIERSNGVIL